MRNTDKLGLVVPTNKATENFSTQNYVDNFDKIDNFAATIDLSKVDKITGKGLSTEDYTTGEKAKVANVPLDTNAQLAEIEQDKAEKTDIGLLSGLLTTAKTSIVNAINELFNNKANKAQEVWIIPTLLNSWEAFDAGSIPQYYKDEMGIVRFRGLAKSGATSTVCLTLPVGYRPERTVHLTTRDTGKMLNGYITSSGSVVLTTVAYSTYIVLDSISFRVGG